LTAPGADTDDGNGPTDSRSLTEVDRATDEPETVMAAAAEVDTPPEVVKPEVVRPEVVIPEVVETEVGVPEVGVALIVV